ncbi:hypothetical protein [Thermodesulfovibrio hydrogeniphilus]
MRGKILIYLLIFLFISQTSLSFAGGIPTPSATCDGSQWYDGTFIPKGQVKEVYYGGVKYRCVGCGGCTPISGSSASTTYTPSYTPSSKLSPSQQLAIGIMGAFLSGFFSTLFSMPDFSDDEEQKRKEYEQQQRKIEEEKKKQEEMKKKLLSQYNALLTQAKSQVQTPSSQSSSSNLAFQTLGGQLTPFQWNTPSLSQSTSNNTEQPLITISDINTVVGNVIQDKVTEKLQEKIEEYGGKLVERLDKKYGKEWGAKYYEKGLPILKIAIAAKNEGAVGAGVETINLGVSLIQMPTLQAEVADVGRKIYSKFAFSALDKFLSETERAAEFLGFNFNKEEFMQNLENDMNTGQKIIYKWLKGE